MILGKFEIVNQMNKGAIIIEPFNENQINPNSYNVRLGNNFYEMKNGLNTHWNPIIDLYKSLEAELFISSYIPDNSYFNFKPHSFILAHTKEKVGTVRNYTTLLKNRSTIARIGLDVCASAGFGDLGFVNNWTLEIVNNTSYTFNLKPGMEIAQIAFMEVVGETDLYNSVYQTKDWKPEDMLPKLGYERFFR